MGEWVSCLLVELQSFNQVGSAGAARGGGLGGDTLLEESPWAGLRVVEQTMNKDNGECE